MGSRKERRRVGLISAMVWLGFVLSIFIPALMLTPIYGTAIFRGPDWLLITPMVAYTAIVCFLAGYFGKAVEQYRDRFPKNDKDQVPRWLRKPYRRAQHIVGFCGGHLVVMWLLAYFNLRGFNAFSYYWLWFWSAVVCLVLTLISYALVRHDDEHPKAA